MIDFALPDELVELRDRVTAFIRDEVMPFEADQRQEYHGPTEDLRHELVAKAKTAGLLSPHGPTEFGGLGLNQPSVEIWRGDREGGDHLGLVEGRARLLPCHEV